MQTERRERATIEPYHLPAEQLLALADEHGQRFLTAEPFPHVVLDARKLASEGDAFFGDFTRHLFAQFNSATFLAFLERLTAIDSLIPDPYFFGGGLHQIEPGGFLKVHADFSWHEKLRLERRLNVLIYLNKDWQPSYGGALELWDSGMTRAVESILPVFNRCVVFATTGSLYHGHPEPLACPPGRTRRSLALFYYRNDLLDGERAPENGSRYRERPGERIRSVRRTVERFTPPIAVDAARVVKRRLRS